MYSKANNKGAVALNSFAKIDVEAISQTEEPSGVNIICRCAGFLGNNLCLATNSKAICAQSNGGNINCQSYNSNC